MKLPFDPTSVGDARRLLETALSGLGVSDAVTDDAVLVLSELVTNSVAHGEPLGGDHLDVWWEVDGDRLRIGVHDGGARATLSPGLPDEGSTGGRGLFIVDALCDTWHVDDDHGTRVVVEMGVRDDAVVDTAR